MCVGRRQQEDSVLKSFPARGISQALLSCVAVLGAIAPAWAAALGADAELHERWAESDWGEEFLEQRESAPDDAGSRGSSARGAEDDAVLVAERGSLLPHGFFRPSLRFGVLEQRAPFAPPVSGSLRQWLYNLEVEFAFALVQVPWARLEILVGGGVAYPTRIRDGLGRLLSEYAGRGGLRLAFLPHAFGDSGMGWGGTWWADVLAGQSYMQYPRHTLRTIEPAVRLGYNLGAPEVTLGAARWLPRFELSGRYAGWLASYDTQEVLPLDQADAAFSERGDLVWSRSGWTSIWSVEVRLAAAEAQLGTDRVEQGNGNGTGFSGGGRTVRNLFGLFAGFTESRYEDLLESALGQGSKSSYRQAVSLGVFWGAE